MRSLKTPTLAILAMSAAFALPVWAQQKSLTQDQVQSLVRSGLGDETGAKAIEQRGIDFVPTEDFLETLRAAGANDAFLAAIRTAERLQPLGTAKKKPLNQVQVFALLIGRVPNRRVTILVRERGIDFEPADDYLQEVRLAGGDDQLVNALRSAKLTKAKPVDPATQTKWSAVREHAARGADMMKRGRADEAEQEYRAALQLEPQNVDLWASLSDALNTETKGEEAISAAREAVRLDPASEAAHAYLAIALRDNAPCGSGGVRHLIDEAWKSTEAGQSNHVNLSLRDCNEHDLREPILQFREAIGLDPDDEWAHCQFGDTFERGGNREAAFAEYSAALRVNPNYAAAHFALGNNLGMKEDIDGAIIEMRAAVRFDPRVALFHSGLAHWLEKMGDQEGALAEYREASELNPLEYERKYEAFLLKANATRQEEKLQHWLGTWVFAGPVKVSSGCGSKIFPLDLQQSDYTIKILSVSPTGDVTAQIEHPRPADEFGRGITIADWSGTATDNTLTLAMDPIPTGSALLAGQVLKSAAGRLEARREGDRYSVEFNYFNSWTSPAKKGCSPDYGQEQKRFLGQMTRP